MATKTKTTAKPKTTAKAKVQKGTKAQKKSTTKTTKVTKQTKADKTKLDTKNVKDTVKKVVETKRELKYNYPEEMKDTIERKTFRQKVRNQIYKFEREIQKLEGKPKASKEKRYKAFRKEVLLVP